jgi:hypothetical protein
MIPQMEVWAIANYIIKSEKIGSCGLLIEGVNGIDIGFARLKKRLCL